MNDDPAYFLYHSIGMYPDKERDMQEALGAFARGWSSLDDSQWEMALGLRAEYLELWQSLISAPEGTLTSAENVTTALFSIIGGLPERYLKGRKLLITADCFPSLHFLLSGLAERYGFTLETVPLRDGESWVREDDIIGHWTEEVGLALLTFVTSTGSYRCDLQNLASHARNMGSLFGVDLTQGIGLIPFSTEVTRPDFVVSTSLKWLCGAPGAGILQMSRNLIAECAPELRGWFSQEDPFSWDLDRFDYAADMRRFDHGTPSAIACVATVPALRWHAEQDAEKLLMHNRALSHRIIEGARDLGIDLISTVDDNRRGGSVMLGMPDDLDIQELVAFLRAHRVFADCRGSILRLSPGNITAVSHVDRLLNFLKEKVGGRRDIM